MNRFKAVPYRDQSEINMSPMLDVVFIMLIFFIVVATFVEESGLPVTLPGTSFDIPDHVESIRIVVEPAGAFIVNDRPMSASSVRPYVQALFAENPDATFGVLMAKGSVVKDAAIAIEAGRSIGLDVVPIARDE